MSQATTKWPRWLTPLLLCCYLAVRGLVPAGFMPASIAAGSPYGLCHGDSRSALLLQSLRGSDQLHHFHQHDSLTAQSFADSHCGFSTAAGLATAPLQLLTPPLPTADRPQLSPFGENPLRRNYLTPPQRAPPRFSRA